MMVVVGVGPDVWRPVQIADVVNVAVVWDMVGLKEVLGILNYLLWGTHGSNLLTVVAGVDVVGAVGRPAGDLAVAVFGAREVGKSAGDSVAWFPEVNRKRMSPIPEDDHKCLV